MREPVKWCKRPNLTKTGRALMSCYHHLSIEEREKLYAFSQKGLSLRKISLELHRAVSTLSRELKRNPDYLPCHAQARYQEQRKQSGRKPLLTDRERREEVKFFLSHFYWSPEQICNRLKAEGCCPASTSTIYRALDNGLLPDTLRYYLRIKYKTMGKAPGKDRRCFSRSIDTRPPEAEERSEAGHWEGDTIVSRKTKTVFVTMTDRKTRYLLAGKVRNKEASEVNRVIIKLLSKMPVRSITLDQGSEFAESSSLERQLQTHVYFAHPHSPWEKPTVENTNGLLRQFIPKRRSLGDISDDDLESIVARINLRPRKCLDWFSPYEIFSGNLLHFY